MSTRIGLRWAAMLIVGAALGLAVTVALVLLVAAASGALTTPPGAWTTRLAFAPGLSLKASVPGLLRFAASPIGLRLLDGRRIRTRAGPILLSRDGDALQLDCAPCRIEATQLSAQTILIGHARLRLAHIDEHTLQGELASGAVRFRFTARLHPERVDLDWQLPQADIAALYRLLGSAIPEAHRARIDGRVQAAGTLRLPQRRARIDLALDGVAVSGLGSETLAEGPIDFACRAADGSAQPRRLVPGEGRWISPAQSGALLAAAVLAAEDQRFYAHQGFDREEIAQVLARIDEQGATRGASTITQQLARGLFTGGERTGLRKLRELLYAVEMERTLGKPTILALYLNTVDWGPGICGADAAARHYFRKRPQQLTPLEAAWLAGILRHPAQAYAQQFQVGVAETDRAVGVLRRMATLPRAERERWARQTLVFAPPPAPAVLAARIATGTRSGGGPAGAR